MKLNLVVTVMAISLIGVGFGSAVGQDCGYGTESSGVFGGHFKNQMESMRVNMFGGPNCGRRITHQAAEELWSGYCSEDCSLSGRDGDCGSGSGSGCGAGGVFGHGGHGAGGVFAGGRGHGGAGNCGCAAGRSGFGWPSAGAGNCGGCGAGCGAGNSNAGCGSCNSGIFSRSCRSLCDNCGCGDGAHRQARINCGFGHDRQSDCGCGRQHQHLFGGLFCHLHGAGRSGNYFSGCDSGCDSGCESGCGCDSKGGQPTPASGVNAGSNSGVSTWNPVNNGNNTNWNSQPNPNANQSTKPGYFQKSGYGTPRDTDGNEQ